jgi:hypothetical protein
MVHHTISSSWTVSDYVVRVLKNLGEVFSFCFAAPVTTKTSMWFAVAIIVVGGLLGFALIRPVIRDDDNYAHERMLFFVIAAYVVGFVTLHTWRLIIPRPWYYASVVPLVWLAIARAMCRMGPLRLTAFSLTAFAFVAGLWAVTLSSRGFGEAPIRPAVAQKLAGEMPAGSRIGIFNAGTIAYFDEAQRIVNLDGLVNNSAYAYIKKNDLCEYLLAQRIDAVGDDAPTLEAWKTFFNGDGPSCVGAGKTLLLNEVGQDWVLKPVTPIGTAQRD